MNKGDFYVLTVAGRGPKLSALRPNRLEREVQSDLCLKDIVSSAKQRRK